MKDNHYTHEIIKSDDGSNTLFVPELNETYHSTHGAIQESQHVFIKMGIDFLRKQGHDSIHILEIGFGTGLNAILTYEYALRENISVNYETIEAYPIDYNLAERLNYFEFINPDLKSVFSEMHRMDWNKVHIMNNHFSFTKYDSKLENFTGTSSKVDLIYFDAFAPSRQADMWTEEQIKKTCSNLKLGGALVTYCANGQFKRNLKAQGLTVAGVEGPPGKREMTRAVLDN